MAKIKKIWDYLDANGHWPVIAGISVYIIIFCLLSVWKYFNFAYNALDLAIINQVFYHSSLGHWFASSIQPPSYLGDHFSPILFFLLPFYYLLPHPLTLLILQTIFLALTAWPIYLIAKRVLSKSWAVFFALVWLLNPFVQNINLFEFEFLPLAIGSALWAFYFYQQKKFWPFIAFCLLSLSVREDVALFIVMFGLLALLEKKQIKWWLTPLLLSAVYFILALKITQYFAPAGQYKFLIYYSWAGNTPGQALSNLFWHPWLPFLYFFRLGNWEMALGLLIPFALLPLLAPWYLLLGLPIFAQLALGSSGGGQLILQTHYSSLLLVATFIAAIYSVKKIINYKMPAKSKVKSAWLEKIIVFIRNWPDLAWLIFVTAILYSLVMLGPLPGTLAKIYRQAWLSAESLAKWEVIKNIPKDAPVAATYELISPLSGRSNIYSFNYVFLGKQQFLTKDYYLPADTQFLAIDFSDLIAYQLQYSKSDFYKFQYQRALSIWHQNLAGFGVVAVKDSVALYQKGVNNQYQLTQILTSPPNPEIISDLALNQKIKHLGYNKQNGQYQLFWQLNYPTPNYCLQLTLKNQKGKIVYQKIYPFAYGLLPPDKNWQNQNIQTNYWFGFYGVAKGTYSAKLNLLEIDKGGLQLDADRSTINVIDKKNIIGQEIDLGQVAI